MIVSPEAVGAQFCTSPVCAEAFRFVERVVQERIVVQCFPDNWEGGLRYLQRTVYQQIPDNTVRLASLQA
jgi:peptide/nickel transport system substrate-binding protein